MNLIKPILFLDIDGVLNSVRWFRKQNGLTKILDPKCVSILQRIVLVTNCSIVIMSTWRLIHSRIEIMQSLCDAGYIPPVPIIGETPRLTERGRTRGSEVDAWLNDAYALTAQQKIIRFCCVDDDADFNAGQPLVQTDNDVGLTNVDADKIIDKLMHHS